MSDQPTKKQWLSVRAGQVPDELRAEPYVLWRAEPRNDKPAKVPYQVAYPDRKASSTDPTTWATFEDAVEAYLSLVDDPADPRRGAVAGIGVVLVRGADVTCIDLDRVVTGDETDVRARTIVERCDSWTERSPSGTGLHVFVRGTVQHALKGSQIEVYSEARYIAITGHRWGDTPDALRWQQPYLEHLVHVEQQGRGVARSYTGPVVPPPDDLAGALLAKVHELSVPAARMKRWADGYLVELQRCPWADEHSTGPAGAAVMIHASGALDFTCLHAHCAGRGWRDFRAVVESPR